MAEHFEDAGVFVIDDGGDGRIVNATVDGDDRQTFRREP